MLRKYDYLRQEVISLQLMEGKSLNQKYLKTYFFQKAEWGKYIKSSPIEIYLLWAK